MSPERGSQTSERIWVSDPEVSDSSIQAATGRTWNELCDVIDARPAGIEGHTAIAAWVHENLDVDHWWSQGVTVGWERITGRRVPGQMADGSFSVSKSRTVDIDAGLLRAQLIDDAGRHQLFDGHDTVLRSKPTSKSLRVAIGPGVALFDVQARPDGRSKVVVSHEKLPSAEDGIEWKAYWTDWLVGLDSMPQLNPSTAPDA